ncbi:uncharacterized protein C17orf78 homolog [Melopsittacus undulatus]|uniref:uncharacterized protein C17orf78 homolog n=1 Tax=Melopsittacus undulatus TaxID=13146 RepID=UPI00146CD040|nr:uncharacterized protein C17orf78 homolog [Melopsittacus undulatus]
MFVILIFSLVFAVNNLSREDLGDYKCHVENASDIGSRVRSLKIFLQGPGIAATKEKIKRTQKVMSLVCYSHESPVHVDVLYLEKMCGYVTDWTVEKQILHGLNTFSNANGKPVTGHTCVSQTQQRKMFPRKLILREKVFLEGMSDCVVTAKLPKMKVFAEGLAVPTMHFRNHTLYDDKDMLNRLKLSIILKVLIAVILIAFVICYIVFAICKIPCSCLGINIQKSVPAGRKPAYGQTAKLLTPFLTEKKPQETFV